MRGLNPHVLRVAHALAVLGVATLAVGGCTALPRSGDVHQFAIEVPAREPIEQFGSSPQAGADPAHLLEAFLLASSAGISDDYQTARQYLVPSADQAWHPESQVVIYAADSSPSVRLVNEDEEAGKAEVAVTLDTVGTLAANGELEESPAKARTTVKFQLERNSVGEWRISSLENAAFLSRSAFESSYQLSRLYFVATDEGTLVADQRWIPRKRSASHLVDRLLEGPRESLSPAVLADLGKGLALSTGGVEVEDRVARVDLEGDFPQDRRESSLLLWSLDQTLRQEMSVTSVQVRINTVVLEEDSLPAGPEYSLERIVAVAGGDIVSGSPSATSVAVAEDLAPTGVKSPAVGPLRDSPVAWLGEDGTNLHILYLNGVEPRVVELTNPGAPSVDRHGNVWITTGKRSDRVTVVAPGKDPETAVTGLAPGTRLGSVSVSPDAAQAVLLVEGPGGGEVWVGTIETGRDGEHRIAELRVEERISDAALDVSWAGDTRLVALVAGGDGNATVVSAELGGWSQQSGAPGGVDRVTAGPAPNAVITQRGDSEAFKRSGAAWVELGEDLRGIRYAG